MDKHPLLRTPIKRLWNTYEYVRFTAASSRNRRRHSSELAPIRPTGILQVSPEYIRYKSLGEFDFISDSGRVEDGRWDLDKKASIEDGFRYPSFVEHFVQDVKWEETDFYDVIVDRIHKGESRYESVEAFEKKCEELDRIYRNISREGYLRQEELVESSQKQSYLSGGGKGIFLNSPRTLALHEISVDIARDGEPLLNEGRHRLCIAKMLELDTVPVRIVVRHRQWQNLRNQVALYLRESSNNRERDTIIREVEQEVLKESDYDILMGAEHPDILTIIDQHLKERGVGVD